MPSFGALSASQPLWLTANTEPRCIERRDAKVVAAVSRLPLGAIDALCIGLESIDFPEGDGVEHNPKLLALAPHPCFSRE